MASPPDRLQRLQRALEAFQRWRAAGGAAAEREAAFLARHEDLRDLLEPMLGEAAAETAAPPDEAGPGTVLGDFRLLRRIGRGGMGVVHEALQLSLGRRVALKVLSVDLADDPQALARFQREALATSELDHRGIAKVLAVGAER